MCYIFTCKKVLFISLFSFFFQEGISHNEPEAPWAHIRQPLRDVPLASTSNDNNGKIFFSYLVDVLDVNNSIFDLLFLSL